MYLLFELSSPSGIIFITNYRNSFKKSRSVGWSRERQLDRWRWISLQSKVDDSAARKLATKFGTSGTKGIDSTESRSALIPHAPFCLPNRRPSACKVDKVSRLYLLLRFLARLPVLYILPILLLPETQRLRDWSSLSSESRPYFKENNTQGTPSKEL